MKKFSSRNAFFDSISGKWDTWEDLVLQKKRILKGLDEFGLGPDEVVLDVGCGTGNVTIAILDKLSDAGRVHAVDPSDGMLQQAKEKVPDPRVQWHSAVAESLPLENGSLDRVICFSVWPHFDDERKTAAELLRVLKAGGKLHIWHLMSRSEVNEIHATAADIVARDLLAPAEALAGTLQEVGFRIAHTEDNEDRYLISAFKPDGPDE